jgi:hypothetical protein
MAGLPQTGSLPEWVRWLAQDADGAWWGYEVEPLCYHRGWYENELGRRVRVADGEPNVCWETTLRRIP